MTGIAGCCARPVTGHAAAAPASPAMNSRLLILLPRRVRASCCDASSGLRDENSSEGRLSRAKPQDCCH
jgi:hypothetical protein